jgi:hypothetical protein
MRKPPKVVPITQAKRKHTRSATEIPVPVEGAIRMILACYRSPNRISFSLQPALQPDEAPRQSGSSKENLIVFPRCGTDAKND